MDITALILLLLFLSILLISIPISIYISLATLLSLLMYIDSTTIAQKMAGSIDCFTLLTIRLLSYQALLWGKVA